MQKKIKTRLTLVHERINEAAKKIEETATQQTVEGRDDKAQALESSLRSLKNRCPELDCAKTAVW